MMNGSARTVSWSVVGFAVTIGGVLALLAIVLTDSISGGGEWSVRLALLAAGLTVACHGVFIFRAGRRNERRVEEIEQLYLRTCEAVKRSFGELRHGDLVEMAAPGTELPEDVAHSAEASVRALAGLIQQIQASSVEVASAAGVVQETSSELASGSSEQAAAVVEITATMEELARTAGQIASNAAAQADLAAKSEEAGEAGAAAVGAAVNGVEAVQHRMDAIASRADSLGSRAREIYRVLDLITDIAQETHVLALNAAIEASAAGEYGERFSVVAAEVRRLAERSRESVDSVRSLLDEFSGGISSMVVATEEGSKSASQVLAQSRSSEAAIDALRKALEDTARTAREISLATQEQRTASDQVVTTLKEVSEVIQRMASGLNQFSGAAERLNHLALSIQLLSQSFRLESVHSLKHQAALLADGLAEFTENLEAVEGRLEDGLKALPYLEMLYMVDTRGAMVAFVVNHDVVADESSLGSLGVGELYAERPWFQAVRRTGRTAVTPQYESLLTGDPCFTIATAVRDSDGEMIGVLGLDVNALNWTRI